MGQIQPDVMLKQYKAMMDQFSTIDDLSKLGLLMMKIEFWFGGFESLRAKEYGRDPEYLSALDGVWKELAIYAVDLALRLGFDPSMINRQRIEFDLYDNYFHAGVAGVAAARIHEPAKGLPLLAWAAFNKHSYRGYKDEIAILRMLLGAGYDPNAQDRNGMTALHYMASIQTYPFSHPRAVRLLIEAGANPNIRNERGDSPLCFMTGNRKWTDELNHSAILMLDAGANPHLAANDGTTPLGMLKEHCDDSQREAIIIAIERTIA